MAITRVNFASVAAGGDSPTAALVKLDNNDADLDARVNTASAAAAAAQVTAAAALPKSGGTMTAPLVMQGGGVASRRGNLYHNANATQDYGVKLTLSSSGSTTDLAGLFLVPTGANGYQSEAQIWLKDGDVYNAAYSQIFRATLGGLYYRSYAVWHAGNTTVDANLFVKKAS